MKKIFMGVVVSDKVDKIVSVKVECCFVYFLYGKVVICSYKYVVYDENNEYKIGDWVEIIVVCFISKIKIWKVIKLIECFRGIEIIFVEIEVVGGEV